MTGPLRPLSAQIVGSYSKPAWLVGANQARRVRRFDPSSYWQPAPEVLAAAQQDAARLAIYEQELAGMAVVTDGEMFRHTYDTSFLLRMAGIDTGTRRERPLPVNEIPTVTRVPRNPAEELEDRSAPRLTGVPHMTDTATADAVAFAKTAATKPVKVAVLGPFTASRRVVNCTGMSATEVVLAFARALNEELRALQDAGADVVQLDEPSAHQQFSAAAPVLTQALDTALAGITIPAIAHVCYGYPNYIAAGAASPAYEQCLRLVADSAVTGISLAYTEPEHPPALLRACGTKHVLPGMLRLTSDRADDVGEVASRIRQAATVVPPERLHPSVDCGMWFVPRPLAFAKLRALGEATALVRDGHR